MSKEAMKLALEGAANYIDALGGDSRKYRQALAEQPAQYSDIVSNGGFDPRTRRAWAEMSDARIKGIFSYHGQTMTGKDLAMLRVIEDMLKENT